MDEQQRSEQDEPRDATPEETTPAESATEQDSGIDAAKLSDEEATLAARAFLGTAEPDEEVSVDEAKNMLRRAGAVAEAEPEGPHARSPADPPVSPGRRWYVIHTYSGYENKVKTNLEHRIQSMDMGDKIFQVLVPTEEEIEIKNGKRHPVERKIFPGYVLVEMVMS